MLTIIIVIVSLILLSALHEFGHFLAARKMGVGVEEFGIGYPPRIFGKKFGKTIYSLNWLPFGAFVKITGEEGGIQSEESFSSKPIWKRMVIILGGVVSFWLVAFIIFSFLAGIWGLPYAVDDNFKGNCYVQVVQVAKNSPAETAGIKPGDIIKKLRPAGGEPEIEIDKVSQIQEFAEDYAGQETIISIERGSEVIEKIVVPRVSPPKGEGAVGLSLSRASKIKSTWLKAPVVGAKVTIEKTIQIPASFVTIFQKIFRKEKVEGVEFMGPIGLGSMMNNALKAGVDNFLMFMGIIAVWLAIFNILPIPALDGGKVLFLLIEAIRRKPVSEKIEQGITLVFFIALLAVMAFVTIKDIIKLF